MGTWRLYTGSDGQSHVEKIDWEKQGDWTKGIPTTDIKFIRPTWRGHPSRWRARAPVR